MDLVVPSLDMEELPEQPQPQVVVVVAHLQVQGRLVVLLVADLQMEAQELYSEEEAVLGRLQQLEDHQFMEVQVVGSLQAELVFSVVAAAAADRAVTVE
jgi:hypothetical protein